MVDYNEETFRYFLAVEQCRWERSGRPFLLLLIDVAERRSASMDRTIAAALFAALQQCLRETDFVGWYREGRVAGAVLTELGDGCQVDLRRRLGRKVRRMLSRGRLSPVARRLRVRVYERTGPESLDSTRPRPAVA